MLLIHTALPFEAHPIIRNLRLRQTGSPGGGRLFTDDDHNYALLVSGVGGEKTCKTLNALRDVLKARQLSIHQALNIGLAADPGKRYPIGTAFNISSVYRLGCEGASSDLSTLNNELKTATLCTLDTPCSDPEEFTKIGSIPLLDMESWYLVDTLRNDYGLSPTEIHSIKVVSDYADGAPFDTGKLAPVYDETIGSLFNAETFLDR